MNEIPRKTKKLREFSPDSPRNMLLNKSLPKSNKINQESKSSKIVSDFLKKKISVGHPSPISSLSDASVSEDEENDDPCFETDESNERKAADVRMEGDLKNTPKKIPLPFGFEEGKYGGREAADFRTHEDRKNASRRILSPLENREIQKHRPKDKNTVRQPKQVQASEKKLHDKKIEAPQSKSSKNYSHLSVAEQVCYEVIDSFLAMNVPRGRGTVVPTCDLNKLR